MLALVKAEPLPTRSRKCREEADIRALLGINCIFLTVKIPSRAGERHIGRSMERCVEILRSLRAEGLCFHRDFPYGEALLERGFQRAGVRALMRAKAAEILDKAAEKHERALLSAPSVDRDVLSCVEGLCGAFRYITVDAPSGPLLVIAAHAARFGVTPSALPRDRVADVDAAVVFSSPEKPIFAAERCRILFTEGNGTAVFGGREIDRVSFSIPERFGRELPEGFSAPEILSAAVDAGRLAGECISVTTA